MRAHIVMKVVAERGKARDSRGIDMSDRDIGFGIQPNQPVALWSGQLPVPNHAVQVNREPSWWIRLGSGQSRHGRQSTSGSEKLPSIVHDAISVHLGLSCFFAIDKTTLRVQCVS